MTRRLSPLVRWLLALGAVRVVSYATMPFTVPLALAALRPPLQLPRVLEATAWLGLSITTSLCAGALVNRTLKRRAAAASEVTS